MILKVKRLTSTAQLPKKAYSTDACYDIYADNDSDIYYSTVNNKYCEGTVIPAHSYVVFNTGISIEIPTGYFCPVFSRSGMGFQDNLRLSNCVGIIDADYRGEWKVKIYNDGNVDKVIARGARIAQFAVLPVLDSEIEEVNEISNTERGENGFGSSGTK